MSVWECVSLSQNDVAQCVTYTHSFGGLQDQKFWDHWMW